MSKNTKPPAGQSGSGTQPSSASGFNLHAVTVEIIRSHPSPDPTRIAETVFEAIPKQQYAIALHLLLRGYVRSVQRSLSFKADPAMSDPKPPLHAPGRSWKRDGIRTGWRARSVHVGESCYKRLADCTVADLRFMEAERAQKAAENTTWEKRLRLCAELIEHHNVNQLGDCPDEEVTTILDGAS